MNPNASFERDLKQWLQAEAPASAPAGFHATVMDRARTLRQRPGWAASLPARWFGRGRGITLLAAAALLLVGGALGAGSGVLRLPAIVPPVPAPSLGVVVTTSPDAAFRERAAPVEVSGELVRPCLVGGTGAGKDPAIETVGGVEQRRGGFCYVAYTWSDPRLNGTITDAVNADEYLDGSGLTIATRVFSIENDEGAWRMRPLAYILDSDPAMGRPEDFIDLLSGSVTWVLDGEGAYEGLVAVIRVDNPRAPHGFIIDGDVPPAPENASTK